jgi:LuxR family transcriptional regulator, maltose regulon positive regulatory protein
VIVRDFVLSPAEEPRVSILAMRSDHLRGRTATPGAPPHGVGRLAAAAARLESAELALSQGRWEDARRSFDAALAVERTPEAHEGLAWAAVWLNDGDGAIEAFEGAHRLYLERGDRRGAGRVACWLAWSYSSFRGQQAVADGWWERERRLLEGLAPGPEHVWLAAFDGIRALRGGDTVAAIERARQAAAWARSLARPDLEALGLAIEGEALVAEGEFAEGLRLLDGAAATAISSGTDDFACVTSTCCSMLAACEITGDIERASQWCQLTSEYALRYGLRNIFAICRTSYAAVLISRGRWREGEAELEQATREFAQIRPGGAGQATARLAELRRRQGRFAEAADLFAQAEGRRDALLGSAALALSGGDAERAGDLAERFLRQTPDRDRAWRALALEVLVRARARRSELAAAERGLDELQSIAAAAPTEWLRALASVAAGLVAMAHDEPARARCQFEDAVDLFQRCGSPFEAARARLDLARAIGSSGRTCAARDEAEAARATFAQLGATHELELATALLAGLEESGVQDDEPRPETGLSARELEVLRLIAEGLTDSQIASRLVISQHTVHRHVSNILRKLGVSSRVVAAAFAHRHGLA